MTRGALLAVLFVFVFAASLATADPVDNPSDFTVAFDTGRIKIGNLQESAFDGVSNAGTVLDTAGNVFIPAAGVSIPDLVVSSPLGDVTVHFVTLEDGTGSLNAVTGNATFSVALRLFIRNTAFPPDCRVDRIDVAFTTGSDGTITGVSYDMTDGTATYVNNSFSVPVTSDCGPYGPIIDAYVGLPADPGVSYINNLHGTYSPVFVGS